jgi:CMP-N-acetylneuraminic acid synthetase
MGSQRLPRKNMLEIEPGVTLVQHAINCARYSGIVTDVAVSSDEDLFTHAHGAHCILRPTDLSGPTADIADAVQHATERMETLSKYRYDYVIALQPAVLSRSPLIVRRLVDAVINENARGGLTMAATHRWIWAADGSRASNDWYGEPYPRSQDGGTRLQEINAVQVADRETVADGARWDIPLKILTLPPWAAALDIDTPEDMAMARDLWPWARTRLETWTGPITTITEITRA